MSNDRVHIVICSDMYGVILYIKISLLEHMPQQTTCKGNPKIISMLH